MAEDAENPAQSLQLGAPWDKWKDQTRMLRSALASKIPEHHLREQLVRCFTIYKASIDFSPSADRMLASISGQNHSPLEAAFTWLGGWRPTSAIILVYSKMGIETKNSTRQSLTSADVASSACLLSEIQLIGIDALQKHTRQAEVDLSNQLALLQMLVADQGMTNALGLGDSSTDRRDLRKGIQHMETKLANLQELYVRANRLRSDTLQELLNLLTPVQAAHCTVAAFELMFAMKALGSIAPDELGNLSCSKMCPAILPSLGGGSSDSDALSEDANDAGKEGHKCCW